MFEQFKALLVDELQVEEDKITPEAELSNDLGINSIELAELVMRCEETFGVDIQDDDIHNFVTVARRAEHRSHSEAQKTEHRRKQDIDHHGFPEVVFICFHTAPPVRFYMAWAQFMYCGRAKDKKTRSDPTV